jgi:hypothetical protein
VAILIPLLRLSPDGELADLSGMDGCLGNRETKKKVPGKGDASGNSLTVWLPNIAFAKIWESRFK